MRADAQSYDIVRQKTSDPRWSVPRIDITPDPLSRFYDGTDPDRPPLPPDDPSANRYMQCAYGMRGPKAWAKLDRLNQVENPFWTESLPDAPQVKDHVQVPRIDHLGLEESIELGLIHSRDYQEQIENMYLSALVLTFQRYRFDVRPIGFNGEPSTALLFRNQPTDQSNLELGPTTLGVSKLLPAGGQAVAELTNNTLWMFSGGNTTATASGLAYSLVQPLFAGAGREIAMENLTQSERNSLYAARDFARFRKEFYTTILTGKRTIPLPGTTGGGELAFLIRGQRSPTEGFYSLLFSLQRWRNQQTNVQSLEGLIRDLELLSQAGRASSLDVTQLESSLATARAIEASRRRMFYENLDRFKLQLGLPPDLDVDLDDSLLQPFKFVDPRLTEIENQLAELVLNDDPARQGESLASLRGLLEMIVPPLEGIEDDFEKFKQVLPERELSEEEAAALVKDMAERREQLEEVRQSGAKLYDSIVEMQAILQEAGELSPEQVDETVDLMRTVRRKLLAIVRQLTGLSISVRVELVSLPEIPFGPDEAVRAGLNCRLDLMNRRGFVMDARRRMEVAADRLEATLNIVAEGELNTQPLLEKDNPVDFRAKDSSFRVGVEVVTPLDRRRQRNNFRAAQISYQRARRNFMAAEDQVKLDVRRELRMAESQREIFEANRRALRVAALELDQAIELGELPDAQPGGKGINISRALDNILKAQNELIEAWVDYETARLSLYRDMGAMDIDERGHWVEPQDITQCLNGDGSCYGDSCYGDDGACLTEDGTGCVIVEEGAPAELGMGQLEPGEEMSQEFLPPGDELEGILPPELPLPSISPDEDRAPARPGE